jgi:hypothetical protein
VGLLNINFKSSREQKDRANKSQLFFLRARRALEKSGGEARSLSLSVPTTNHHHLLLRESSLFAVMSAKKSHENDIWDDSALVESWNEALEEYEVNPFMNHHQITC